MTVVKRRKFFFINVPLNCKLGQVRKISKILIIYYRSKQLFFESETNLVLGKYLLSHSEVPSFWLRVERFLFISTCHSFCINPVNSTHPISCTHSFCRTYPISSAPLSCSFLHLLPALNTTPAPGSCS